MANLKGIFEPKTLAMVVIFAISIIYLLGMVMSQSTVHCTQADIDSSNAHGCNALTDTYTSTKFNLPTQSAASSGALWLLKFLIIGGATTLAAVLAFKFAGGSLGRRDVLSLVIVAIAVYFAYIYIAQPILGASSLETISFHAAAKLGMLG